MADRAAGIYPGIPHLETQVYQENHSDGGGAS